MLQKKNIPQRDNNTYCHPSLLLHYFETDNLTGWNNQITALGKHFDLFIPDLVIFRNSTIMRSERFEIFQADCMKSIAEYLREERVIMVRHSYDSVMAF